MVREFGNERKGNKSIESMQNKKQILLKYQSLMAAMKMYRSRKGFVRQVAIGLYRMHARRKRIVRATVTLLVFLLYIGFL